MSQLAVLFTCQTPFRSGLPSGRRRIAVVGAWAPGSAMVTRSPATTAAVRLASTAGFCLLQRSIGHTPECRTTDCAAAIFRERYTPGGCESNAKRSAVNAQKDTKKGTADR